MSKEEVIRRRGSSGEIDGIVSIGIVLLQWERTLRIIVSSQRENTELTTSRDDMDRRERWMGLYPLVELYRHSGRGRSCKNILVEPASAVEEGMQPENSMLTPGTIVVRSFER